MSADDRAARASRDLAVRDDVDRYEAWFLGLARALDPGSLGAPSRCAGWTRGHILSHIARNADALRNCALSATTGRPIPMYASQEARDAGIEAGSGRPLDEQVADLEASADRLRPALAALTPDVVDVEVQARGGIMIRAGIVPRMRLRELVFHGIDLDSGASYSDLDDSVVTLLLIDAVARLRGNPQTPSMTIRTHEGDAYSIGDGVPTVSGTRAGVLAWLARGLTDGLDDESTPPGVLPTLPFGG